MIGFGIYISLEALHSDTGMRMLNYTSTLVWTMILATSFNAMSMTCRTIAYQNDRSGFIVLFTNLSLVYFFFADTFIFDESFSKMELIGTLMIMTVVLGVAIVRILTRNKEDRM